MIGDKPLVGNAADPEQIDEARDEESFLGRLRRDDLEFVLSDSRGRRFIWDLFGSTNLFTSCFDREALLMAFRAGRRDVGLELFREVAFAFPEKYAEMVGEALKEQASKPEPKKEVEED